MKSFLKIVLAFIIITQLGLTVNAQRKREFNQSFEKKDKVKITTVLGDCQFEKSSDDKIHVYVEYTYEPDIYEIYVNEGGDNLYLEEEFDDHNPRGYSLWSVSVPDGVKLKVESATGSLKFDRLDVELDANSGTGDIDLRNCKGIYDANSGTGSVYVLESSGEFVLNSGTGNVELKTVAGQFDLNSGTGDVEATDISFEGRSEMNSGTGDVFAVLAKNPAGDININSGTGDAELNLNGIDPDGHFVLSCNYRSGHIKCPFDVEAEKSYRSGHNNVLKKSFTKGSSSNKIKISTGSGTARLSLD